MNVTELRQATAELVDVDGQVLVYPGKSEYLANGGGLSGLKLHVRVLVGPESDEQARERLDRMLALDGPESVKAQLDADDTCGGRVSDMRVVAATGYQTFPASPTPLLGCEWVLEVIP